MKSNKMALLSVLGGMGAVIIFAGMAFGTILVKQSLPQMTRSASVIVEGKVISKQARWDENHRRIITETTIKVDKALKGVPGGVIVVRTLGGEVGGVGMMVSGEASFDIGEEVLLLLEPHPMRDYRIIGMNQGKLRIVTDKKTGRKDAVGPVEPSAPLPDVESQIRAIVSGGGR